MPGKPECGPDYKLCSKYGDVQHQVYCIPVDDDFAECPIMDINFVMTEELHKYKEDFYEVLDLPGSELNLVFSKKFGGGPIVRTKASLEQPCLDPEETSLYKTTEISNSEELQWKSEGGKEIGPTDLEIDRTCHYKLKEEYWPDPDEPYHDLHF